MLISDVLNFITKIGYNFKGKKECEQFLNWQGKCSKNKAYLCILSFKVKSAWNVLASLSLLNLILYDMFCALFTRLKKKKWFNQGKK